eukprot:gene19197-21119_t
MYNQVIQQSIQGTASNADSEALPYPTNNAHAPQPHPQQSNLPYPPSASGGTQYPAPMVAQFSPARPNSSGIMAPRVMLNISCRQLRDTDVLSKSDPMVVVFLEVGQTTSPSKQWHEIGRTERIENNQNPDFAQSILVDYFFEERQKLKFEVYDVDSMSQDLSKHDFLGRAETTLGSIMGENCGKFEMELKSPEVRDSGRLLITAEEMSTCKEMLTLHLRGRKLDKKDFLGASDPFLVFYKCNEDNSYTAVHKTEVIKNNLNPSWNAFTLPVVNLCNGDYDRTIKVDCFDWDSDGSHDLIGEMFFTMNELKANPSLSKELINQKKKKKKSHYKNSGSIEFNNVKIVMNPSFVDYLHRGVEICFTVAVDFTASNGSPSTPSSLHFRGNDGLTDYVRALDAVGQICQDYDKDKIFPAFGFGAKVPPSFAVSHMFPLNGTQDPNCLGINGVIQAYYAAVQNVTLYGPTNFSPVINQVAMLATQNETINPGRKYFVLLILTDGEISDMAQTKRAIVQASYLPMSIIIVGVGRAGFDAMKELDGDDQGLSCNGKYAERDIVQFVSFNKFLHHNAMMGSALAREVLAEVPDQLCSYMKKRGLKPTGY